MSYVIMHKETNSLLGDNNIPWLFNSREEAEDKINDSKGLKLISESLVIEEVIIIQKEAYENLKLNVWLS